MGRQRVIEKLIDTALDRVVYDYEIAYTKAAKHATMLAKEAAGKGFDVVVTVGGDGSVNEVAKGLIGTRTAMAIIPTGSGNGLARYLKIPLNLKRAMAVINAGKETLIDTVQLNDEVFANIAGVGFDAHIGWAFAKFGKRGFSSYLKVIRRELPKYKAQDYEVIVDGKVLPQKAFLISVANGGQWGNNAYIAPLADIADGYMDIVVLKDVSFFSSLSIGIGLFRKTLHRSSYVEVIKCKEAVIRQKNTIAHIDGEPIEPGKELVLRVRPLSLKVIVP